MLLAVVVATGLAVHLGARGSLGDIAGDALYAVAAYLLVVLIAPRMPPIAVGGIAAAWCVAVELLQLTGIPRTIAGVFPPFRLVLGTGFDPRDLVVYLVTAAVVVTADAALRVRGDRRP